MNENAYDISAHPHADWDKRRLEQYIGTTETLRVEFKSHRSLLPAGKKSRGDRVREAARDIAGMANEQGGTIIYGIEETHGSGFRQATELGDGFSASDGVDREWVLAVMRDHISPSLTELDVAHVDLGDGRIALVVLVPQSRGIARQTTDLFFPRRDAQGIRNMTVQEIEDIRSRTERPVLGLGIESEGQYISDKQASNVKLSLRIVNRSSATATFCVITVGFPQSAVTALDTPEWVGVPSTAGWFVYRSVIASGSSPRWSPLTPGFTLAAPGLRITVPLIQVDWDGIVGRHGRPIGLARLDHDGGATSYVLEIKALAVPRVIATEVSDVSSALHGSEGKYHVPDLFKT